MTREDARQEIRAEWRRIIPTLTTQAKKNVNGEASYICPLCGHGTNGDGLTKNPRSKNEGALKCFGCGFSGDILQLYMQTRNVDYNTALQALADELRLQIGDDSIHAAEPTQKATEATPTAAGDKMPTEAPKEQETAKETLTAGQTDIENYMEYFKECTARLSDPAAALYLSARGISQKTAARYMIGFDPAADPMNEPGASSPGKGYPAPRIIIPASMTSYTGRRIDGIDQFKHANTPGRIGIFNGQALFSENNKALFVTEGAFNALSIIEAGGDAIATCSASNVEKLTNIIDDKPIDKTLILAFDNDEAGNNATKELAERLKVRGIKCVIAPDEIRGSSAEVDANRQFIENPERFKAAVQKLKKENDEGSDVSLFLDRVQGETYRSCRTGIEWFDDLLGGGIIPKTLIILTAAPATGKTTLCMNLSEQMAERGQPILYINLEMAADQMRAKALSYRAELKGRHIDALTVLQGYKWTPNQRQIVEQTAEEYKQISRPVYDETGYENIEQILESMEKKAAAAEKRGKKAPAVILDYLHIVRTADKRADLAELIKTVVYGLKEYAKRHNTFCIAISAVSRTAAKSRLGADSGRDSSNVEFSADYMLSLNYDEIDNGIIDGDTIAGKNALEAEKKLHYRRLILRCDKNRFGKDGTWEHLYFKAANNIFYSKYSPYIPKDASLKEFRRRPGEAESTNIKQI